MRITLRDKHGAVLTEILSHLGRPGQLLVDSVAQPGALFQYYFERGGRSVTLMYDAAHYSAVLSTRWKMGVRFWFLHQFDLLWAPYGADVRSPHASALLAAAPAASEMRRPPVVPS